MARNLNKQALMFKLWTILNLDMERMSEEIFFYGIDAGYINKRESLKLKKVIVIGEKEVPVNIPETGETVGIDSKYKDNDWSSIHYGPILRPATAS